ncbi:uncharacterized protein METZ01_LOCUS501209, partial [marine metagenome]
VSPSVVIVKNILLIRRLAKIIKTTILN